MANFSFDIVSDYDKAEMNNVFDLASRELNNRYDFKGTSASIDWLDNKTGLKIVADNEFQIEGILNIIRSKLASRNQSSKVLDLSKNVVTSNLKANKEIPFVSGLSSDKAKNLSKKIRDAFSKVKIQIQGEALRVTSNSKDDLQKVIGFTKELDLDYPVNFINFR